MTGSSSHRVWSRRERRRGGQGPVGVGSRRRGLGLGIVLSLLFAVMPTAAQADHHVTSTDSGYGWMWFKTYTSGSTCRNDGTVGGTGGAFTQTGSEQQRIAHFDTTPPDRQYDQTSVRTFWGGHLRICANAAATNCQDMRGWGGKGRLTRTFITRPQSFGTPEIAEVVVYDLTGVSWDPAVGVGFDGQFLRMTGRYRATSSGSGGSGPDEPWGEGTVLIDLVMAESVYASGSDTDGFLDQCQAHGTLTLHDVHFVEDPESLLPG